MQLDKEKTNKIEHPKSTGVLPRQKVNVSVDETEMWAMIDGCDILMKNKDLDYRYLQRIVALKNKIFEAQDLLWEVKEIRTRKNSLLANHKDYFEKKSNNPILLEGEI
tara:strand:- start:357 stop:680 length:324 start_codon:yes stop_codon:yes gene_type:complete